MAARDDARSPPLVERLATVAAFLGRLDYRNLRMLPNALSILARPSVADWYYNRDLVSRELPRAVRNLLFSPDDMNDFQRHCPVAGYVSTPDDGILAGFTQRGRMSTLLAPHTGFTQQLPYFETGGTLLNGARPREGAFFGVRAGGSETARDDVTWLWESEFGHGMAPGPDPGSLQMTYESLSGAPIEATEVAAVPPGSETVVRELSLRNVSDEPIDRVVYYMQANANATQQYPPGITSPNRATARDRGVHWRDRRSDTGLRLVAGDDVTVAETSVADGPLADLFADARATVDGRHVGGYLACAVDLPPGAETTVSIQTTAVDDDTAVRRDSTVADGGRTASAGDTADQSESSDQPWTSGQPWLGDRSRTSDQPRAGDQSETDDCWAAVLENAPVERIPERFRAQYERSLVGIAKLSDPKSGSLSAAPNFQPMYYPSWPRDGAFIAIALAEAGVTGPAKAYLAEFLPGVQGTDGGFEQCYTSDGAAAGVIPRENDQQGIYAHAVRMTYELTGDEAFLRAAWPAVRRALAYTVDAIADNGLLQATPDFAEMPTHARQSLWTNAFAYRGLLDGGALADVVGAEGERFRRAAAHIGDAMDQQFFRDRAKFATHLTIRGPERADNVAFSAAVHPTGWAADYGHVAPLLDGFTEIHDSGERYWLPREFTYAAALYAAGRVGVGDRVLAALQNETLLGGTLAEEVDRAGEHHFAALGWANAAFVHALHVREGIAADLE